MSIDIAGRDTVFIPRDSILVAIQNWPDQATNWWVIGIASLSLATSVVLVLTTLIHNRKAVRPGLFLIRVLPSGPVEPGIYLENVGVGPAVVESFRYELRGHVLENPTSGALNDLWCLFVPSGSITFSTFLPGMVWGVGMKLYLVSLIDPVDERARDLIAELRIEIKYESVYGESFTEFLTPLSES